MTREEASKILYHEWQAFLEEYVDYGVVSEAYKMAIKALEQEPCDDAISREDAIKACLNGWNKDYKEILEDIKQLPSVQPKTDVLDEIRAEMEDLASHKIRPISFDQAVAVDMCINIIDKYRQEGEE